jgi:DNA-binding NtrC family response regulator
MSSVVPTPENKPHILVVDDEPAMLRVMAWALRECGTTVAHSAEEALVLLERHPFSAVVSDNSMPGTSGIQFLEMVAVRYPEIRRIMHSGSAPENLADLMTAGVIDHFVAKPGHTAVADICSGIVDGDDDVDVDVVED